MKTKATYTVEDNGDYVQAKFDKPVECIILNYMSTEKDKMFKNADGSPSGDEDQLKFSVEAMIPNPNTGAVEPAIISATIRASKTKSVNPNTGEEEFTYTDGSTQMVYVTLSQSKETGEVKTFGNLTNGHAFTDGSQLADTLGIKFVVSAPVANPQTV